MKGTIVKCLEELVRTKHGDERWKAVLANSGMSPTTHFVTMAVVPDGDVLKLLGSTAFSPSRYSVALRAANVAGSKFALPPSWFPFRARFTGLERAHQAARSAVQRPREPQDNQHQDNQRRGRPTRIAVARMPPTATAQREQQNDYQKDHQHGSLRSA